jgi:ParB-like chromosome segregation protein Spo0J
MTMPIIENIPIKKLKLLERNPRRITDAQFSKLCQSIKDDIQFLILRPCLVDRRNDILTVYAGNQRVRAAKKLGMKTIPCIIEDHVPDEIMHQRIIKDNKTYGDFDFDILANEWSEEELMICGFDEKELGFLEEDYATTVSNKDNKEDEEIVFKRCPHCNGLL